MRDFQLVLRLNFDCRALRTPRMESTPVTPASSRKTPAVVPKTPARTPARDVSTAKVHWIQRRHASPVLGADAHILKTPGSAIPVQTYPRSCNFCVLSFLDCYVYLFIPIYFRWLDA